MSEGNQGEGDLWCLSAAEAASSIKKGDVSAREVVESNLERLASVNPALNAVVQTCDEEALKGADDIDSARQRGDDLGPLAGVPITVKVNVDQKGWATTNGLRLQKDLIAESDNPVVANLRAAGALIIGRTNTPAFSLHWFTRNSLHGHSLNPHNNALTPGGSSGGAAAATAAGIGAIGHGTDIAGSVRYPAYACGIHGLRPSLGRVPAVNRSGPDRLIGAQLMAVSGPLARTMADIRLAYEAMAVGSASDPWWGPVPLHLSEQPKKVALARAPEGLVVQPAVTETLEKAAGALQSAGWTVDEVPTPPWREMAALQARLWLAEFRRSGAAAVEEEGDPDAKFIYQQMAARCPAPDLNDLLDTLQARLTLARQWQEFFEDWPLVLSPVSAEVPFPDLLDLESKESFERVMEAQLPQIAPPFIGLPGLAVAAGPVRDGVPLGVQLLAGRYREDSLLAAGEVLEEAFGLPTIADL